MHTCLCVCVCCVAPPPERRRHGGPRRLADDEDTVEDDVPADLTVEKVREIVSECVRARARAGTHTR